MKFCLGTDNKKYLEINAKWKKVLKPLIILQRSSAQSLEQNHENIANLAKPGGRALTIF